MEQCLHENEAQGKVEKQGDGRNNRGRLRVHARVERDGEEFLQAVGENTGSIAHERSGGHVGRTGGKRPAFENQFHNGRAEHHETGNRRQ